MLMLSIKYNVYTVEAESSVFTVEISVRLAAVSEWIKLILQTNTVHTGTQYAVGQTNTEAERTSGVSKYFFLSAP